MPVLNCIRFLPEMGPDFNENLIWSLVSIVTTLHFIIQLKSRKNCEIRCCNPIIAYANLLL